MCIENNTNNSILCVFSFCPKYYYLRLFYSHNLSLQPISILFDGRQFFPFTAFIYSHIFINFFLFIYEYVLKFICCYKRIAQAKQIAYSLNANQSQEAEFILILINKCYIVVNLFCFCF